MALTLFFSFPQCSPRVGVPVMGQIEIYVAENFEAFLFKGDLLLSVTYIHSVKS